MISDSSEDRVQKNMAATLSDKPNENPQEVIAAKQMFLSQQQLSPLISQLRLLAGSIHSEQKTNLAKAIHLYFKDLNQSIYKEQSIIAERQYEISDLKLQLKGAKNDFAEMKSSLILEMEEQRAVVEHLKEEIRLERQNLSNTVRNIMEQNQRKDEEMKKLKEECENEVRKLKSKISVGKGDEQEQSARKRTGTVYERQRTQLLKSQQMSKERHKEEIVSLLKAAYINVESEQSNQLMAYIDSLINRTCELELSVLQGKQQINTQISLTYLTSSKSLQSNLLLSQQAEEIQELKEKITKLTQAVDVKETQITDLRNMIDRYLKEKEENNKYLGTKWEHEIERVMLNAQIEFDREKNRIKRAGEQRLAQVERMQGNKIQSLRQENRNLRENKLKKAIERVRELQNTVKDLQDQAALQHQNHRQEVQHFKKMISNLKSELQNLSATHRATLNFLEDEKLRHRQTLHQLEYLRLTLHEKSVALQNQIKGKLEKKKVELQRQKFTFITESKQSYEQIVKKFEQEQRVRQQEQQQEFRKKCEELFVEVNKTKREHEELCQSKVKQVTEEKQDMRKAYERMIRTAKQEQKSKQEEYTKARTKTNAQMKELKETLNKKQEQILKNKQTIEGLVKDKKNLQKSIASKNQQISSLKQQIQYKEDIHIQLQSLHHSLSMQHQELRSKYSGIQTQILQLKKFFMREHSNLKEQHSKIVKGYRSYIKQIEEACFSTSDRNIYIREIRRLKSQNSDVEIELKNAQNKLITLKELAKYQNNKIERLEHQDKERESPPYRSVCRIRTEYQDLNLTQRRATNREVQQLNNSADNIKIEDSPPKEKEGMMTRYLKLSKIRVKNQGRLYQQSRLKKSKVGLSHIDTYSLVGSQRDRFKLLMSPRMPNSFRIEAPK